MTIKTRILKLENVLAVSDSEIYLVGWGNADFYPATEEELQQAKKTGNYFIWRE